MNLKVVGGIATAIILIVVIIVLVYQKSFFSKKSSESTIDDNEKESSKKDDTTSVTEEESEYDESDFEEENLTGGTNYEIEQENEDEENEDEENENEENENEENEDEENDEYHDISNYCPGDTDGKTIFINAVSTKFSTTENNSDECRNLCSETTDCEMYLNRDENTCFLYKDVNDISMYCETGPGHKYYGNVKIKDGVNPVLK